MNNYLKYVNATPKQSKGQMILQAVCPLFLALVFGIVPSVILQGNHKYIAAIMLCISVIVLVVVLICTSGNTTTKKDLLCNSVISFNWTFQFILSQLTFLFMIKEVSSLFIIFFFPLLVPFFLGLATSRKLKNTFNVKNNIRSGLGAVFGVTGTVGVFIAKFFLSDVEQGVAITLFFLSFTFCACIMSIGLLNIQKLYYLQKYER